MKLAPGARVVSFTALEPESSVVVTVSGSASALPGTEAGSVKVTPFTEYPPKGRATGGVRCHRFLKGEDELVFAWAGAAPALAAADSGAPVDLPEPVARRDGSGQPGSQPIVACAGPVTATLPPGAPRPLGPPPTWQAERMAHPVRSRAISALAFALVTPMLLAGCGGEEKKADEESPAEVMADRQEALRRRQQRAHRALDRVHAEPRATAYSAATGDITHDPAFEGDVKVVLGGLTATVPVTSTGGKVHAKLPLQTKYTVIDPAEYGAPDPADFADPEDGLAGLLAKMEGLKKGKEKRSADAILTSYTGTIPGAAVKKIIPSAVAKETYETTVGIDEKGYASTVKVTGPFFTGNDDVTYDVKFSEYDKGVKITPPAA